MTKFKIKINENEKLINLQVELLPMYEECDLFNLRKSEVQEIISKMVVLAKTRGRPKLDEGQGVSNAA